VLGAWCSSQQVRPCPTFIRKFVCLYFVIVSVIESFSYSVRNMAHDKATSLPVFLEIGAFGLICDGFMSFWRLELHLKDGES
jgi:hypothetical protein